jgi:hypothetical protein
LAEARVIARDLSIHYKDWVKLDQRIKKEIRRVKRKEAKHKMHSTIRRALHLGIKMSDLMSVDVPAASNHSPCPSGPDPKTWTGPWRIVGCFDRIANPLVVIFMQILGVVAPTLDSLAKTWELSVHRIRSAYGISSHSDANEAGYLLFRPGQDSSIGPFLWPICFLLISLSLSHSTLKIDITCVEKKTEANYAGETFVDNTGLGTNNRRFF